MITTNNTAFEVTLSDNSHLFGVPFVIHEEAHAVMEIDREDLREWVDKILPLSCLEFHLNYRNIE